MSVEYLWALRKLYTFAEKKLFFFFKRNVFELPVLKAWFIHPATR